MPLSTIASIGGSIIGAASGLWGARESAKRSQAQAREQMAFQERMSSTAYQRAADDLDAAGLNRIIALGNPASSPAGAMGQVPDFGTAISTGMQAGTSTAIQAAKLPGELVIQKREADRLLQQADVLSKEAKIKLGQSKIWSEVGPLIGGAIGDFSKLVEVGKEIAANSAGVDSQILQYLEDFIGWVMENWNFNTGLIPIPE